MKVQSTGELMAEMLAVARGEREAPADAALPSAESVAAAKAALRRAALDRLTTLDQEPGLTG
jgi:hypothetical protein